MAPCTQNGIEIKIADKIVSKPYVDMTIDIMEKAGITVQRDGYQSFFVKGCQGYQSGNYFVEPDCSQAGYFWAAAAIVGNRIKVKNISMDSRQGDVQFANVLKKMGCEVQFEDDGIAVKGGKLKGIEVDMSNMPDIVPTLAVVASFANGTTVITNVAHLKEKECDRLGSVATELIKMGVNATATESGLIIKGTTPKGAIIKTYNDHRMAMCFAIAGLKVPIVGVDIMSGSSFGVLFKITTWGESHGKGVGVIVEGCPSGIPLDEMAIQTMLDKRKPGSSSASTTRKELDKAIIMSGVFEGKTTGTPIMIVVYNKDADSKAYKKNAELFRPGHGDITYQAKYGIRDWRGGGRASARETVARVAAGAVAKVLLDMENIETFAYTVELGGIKIKSFDFNAISQNKFCCPDMKAAGKMEEKIQQVLKKGDSVGGIVEIKVKGIPAGLGDPVFDKLDADFAKALMSIGAVKGVEIGAGFNVSEMTGYQNNDQIVPDGFLSNNSGGILAGISNGDEIIIRVAVKPIPSISLEQKTIDKNNNPVLISTKGRHDISAIPRINVVCESMVNLVIADHFLRQRVLRQRVLR